MPRRLPTLVALLAIALGLGACGGASKRSGGVAVLSPSALANVADKTSAKGGVRMSMQQTMSLGSDGTIPTTADGVFDTRTRRGEMTMSMDLSSLSGVGELGAGESEQHMIFDGLTFYMRSPMFEHALPAGKRWLKFDLQKVGKQAGVDFDALTQGGSQDPTQALQYLKAATGDVTKLGTESVRGEPTTHYKATIDFRKVPATVAADERAAVRRSIEQIIRLAGTSTAPMEVWIGDDGLLRRMTETIRSKLAGERATITQRIEYYDFGTKVDVKIPSAAESVDIGDLGSLLSDALTTG